MKQEAYMILCSYYPLFSDRLGFGMEGVGKVCTIWRSFNVSLNRGVLYLALVGTHTFALIGSTGEEHNPGSDIFFQVSLVQ